MTIQQLEYILAVDQFRHFARAAEYCRVTQPTLSAMIQKLEDELGVKLFDRTVQPVCPTAIGEKIIDQARVILAQTAQVKEIISEEKQSLAGVFHLGVLPTIAPYLLPRFFPQLMEKYPELDIRVTEMKTQNIQQALHAGDIDAAIIASKLEDTFLKEETLFYETFFGYVSCKEPLFKHDVIRTSDITGERLWLLDEGHCFRDQLVRLPDGNGQSQSDGLPSGKYGNLYAYGRKRKRNHLHSRTGCFATERRTKETGTSVCHSPSYTADSACDQ